MGVVYIKDDAHFAFSFQRSIMPRHFSRENPLLSLPDDHNRNLGIAYDFLRYTAHEQLFESP